MFEFEWSFKVMCKSHFLERRRILVHLNNIHLHMHYYNFVSNDALLLF